MDSANAPPPPSLPARRRKHILLDALSTKWLVVSAIGLFIAMFIMVIVGAYGPVAGASRNTYAVGQCANPSNCSFPISLSLPDITPYNQATWFVARLKRPLSRTTGQPVLPAASIPVPLSFTLTVTGDGNVLVNEKKHTVEVTCMPNQPLCSGSLLFAQSHIYFTKYTVNAVFDSPTAAFASVGSDLDPAVTFELRQGYVAETYTTFQIGWKMFFLVVTAIILVAYAARLITGPGARDEERKIIPSSTEQKWVLALGILLFFFNDPTFPSYITRPSLPISGFYATCSFTFLAVLLLYWLVAFDLARIQGENGLSVEIDDLEYDKRPGACFWLPKVLLIAVYWTIGIASYMYVRIMQFEDPSFSVVEALGGQQVVQWFGTFAAGIAGVYVLYLFVLFVLACRSFRKMRPSNRFVVAVTVTALIVILCGLFLNSFTSLRDTSAAFLAPFGASNLYVWTLMLLHLPSATGGTWLGGEVGGDGGAQAFPPPNTSLPQGQGGEKEGDGDVTEADVAVAVGDDHQPQDKQADRRRRVSRIMDAAPAQQQEEQQPGEEQQ